MQTATFVVMTNQRSKREFETIDAETLDDISGGWSLGGYFSGSISGFGVSKSFTVDTSGNVYTTTGTGPTFPGIGVSAGAFYSNGAPQDHFAGDGLSTTIGAGKTGVEVGTSESGQNIGLSLGVGVSPVNSADTHSEQAGTLGDYVGGAAPDPTAFDAMGNYTGVGAAPADATPVDNGGSFEGNDFNGGDFGGTQFADDGDYGAGDYGGSELA